VASGVNERLGSLTVPRFYRLSPEDITGGDLEYRRNHRSPIAARLRNMVWVFRTKGESTRLWTSRTCPIYVEFRFFSIALAAEMSTSEPFWISRFRTTLIAPPS
jgi:hypothetical protein